MDSTIRAAEPAPHTAGAEGSPRVVFYAGPMAPRPSLPRPAPRSIDCGDGDEHGGTDGHALADSAGNGTTRHH